MTIDELASISGVPKGTLNKIIGGVTKAPTLDNMKAIARALGKTLADFDDAPNVAKKSPSVVEDAPGEKQIISLYRELNTEGQEKLLDYADDLLASGKYIKSRQDNLGHEKMA